MSKLRCQSTGLYPALQTTKGGVRKQLQRTPSHKFWGYTTKTPVRMAISSIRSNTPLAHAMVEPLVDRPLSGANLDALLHVYRRKVNVFLILSFSFRCLSKLGCPAPYSARRSPKFAGAAAALRSFTCSRPRASAKFPIPERPSAASNSALYLVFVLIS